MSQHPALKAGNAAVITGGASGIGLAAAKAFIELGMNVMIADLKGEKLKRAGDELAELAEKKGVKALAHATDVSDLSELEELECAANRAFGNIHVLMNNAGIQPGTAIFGKQIPWDRIIGVNLTGVINGTRIFAPEMRAHGEPAMIINTGSKQGITTPPGNPAYNVAKAGVVALSESLLAELQPLGIKVNVVCPSFFQTNLLDSYHGPDHQSKNDMAKLLQSSPISAQEVADITYRESEADQFMILPHERGRLALEQKRADPQVIYQEMFKLAARRLEQG